ncbi:MAG: glycosyltransferase family 4 protein [Myxococcota bacterium]|nr:glycosyltransferase family 4 protein [Myxococcota bacterium]
MTNESSQPAGSAFHLALIGAFPFPYPQGSQIFARDQARALQTCGARPEFFSYGRGQGQAPSDLEVHVAPAWSSPRNMRSGLHWSKPLADLALGQVFAETARKARAQGDGFDCVLAHNAEAASLALALRPITRVPVIYVVHTILRHELSAYLPEAIQAASNRTGQALDRWIAARCDGLIALGPDAARELEPYTEAPLAVIPPGHFREPPPADREISHVCHRHELTPRRYALYSGNLDRYQDLSLLEEAAPFITDPELPIVVACHDSLAASRANASGSPSLRYRFVEGFQEMRSLIHGAESLILPRQRPGGFPIKLLNYMEASRPIVAFEGIAPTLVDGESASLLARGASGQDLARAVSRIRNHPELGVQLGDGARKALEQEHDWKSIGRKTCEHVAHSLARKSRV